MYAKITNRGQVIKEGFISRDKVKEIMEASLYTKMSSDMIMKALDSGKTMTFNHKSFVITVRNNE